MLNLIIKKMKKISRVNRRANEMTDIYWRATNAGNGLIL